MAIELRSRRPATGCPSDPKDPSVPESVPESVPRKRGCPTECPTGCLWAPSGPGPRSVQKASRECPRVSGTPLGHSRDTFWTLRSPGPAGPPETPRGTLRRTPPFSGTLSGTLSRTLGPFGLEGHPVAGRRDRNNRMIINRNPPVFRRQRSQINVPGSAPPKWGRDRWGCENFPFNLFFGDVL